MKFKNAVAVTALMGQMSAVRIKGSGNYDEILESSKPEE